MLGLGGGALTSFILANFEQVRVDAVDCDKRVISVAYRFFGLKECSRLTVRADLIGRSRGRPRKSASHVGTQRPGVAHCMAGRVASHRFTTRSRTTSCGRAAVQRLPQCSLT
jgi:hypothetical protein